MDNSTIFLNFENPRRGRQARNLSENDPKILDLKSSSEQIIFRKLSLGAPAPKDFFESQAISLPCCHAETNEGKSEKLKAPRIFYRLRKAQHF